MGAVAMRLNPVVVKGPFLSTARDWIEYGRERDKTTVLGGGRHGLLKLSGVGLVQALFTSSEGTFF